MTHTIRGFNGMENRDNHYWIPGGVAPTLSQLQASNGLWSWRWAPAGSWGYRKVRAWDVAVGNGDAADSWAWTYCWLMMDLYIDTLPGAGQDAILLRGDATLHALGINELGQVRVYANGAPGAYSVGTLPVGQWVQVSYKCFKDGSAGSIQAIVRSKATGSELANVAKTHAAGAAHNMGIGCNSAYADYGVYYFDNIVIEGDNAAANVDDPYTLLGLFYGEVVMAPNGVGADNDLDWTGTWADVDDIPQDGDTTYRSISNAVGPFTSVIEDCEAKAFYPIGAVHALINYAWPRSGGGSNTLYLRLRSGGSAFDAGTAMTFGGSYAVDCAYIYRLDPVDSQPWTVTRVLTVQCGVDATAGTGTARITATDVSILVVFSTTPPPAQRLVDYTLDVNHPDQPIVDNNGLPVPPEELRPNRWLRVVGWRAPTTRLFADFLDDSEMVPIVSVNFAEPDGYSLGSGSDDMLDYLLAAITGRTVT